jgi:hypothetical protein
MMNNKFIVSVDNNCDESYPGSVASDVCRTKDGDEQGDSHNDHDLKRRSRRGPVPVSDDFTWHRVIVGRDFILQDHMIIIKHRSSLLLNNIPAL